MRHIIILGMNFEGLFLRNWPKTVQLALHWAKPRRNWHVFKIWKEVRGCEWDGAETSSQGNCC